jgi:ubiquinone/menaquinone biosynthesis C-methylase UbiE
MRQAINKGNDWFQDWANEYDNTLGKVKRHHKLLDLVVNLSKIKKNDHVLDIGCGTGLLSLKFLEKTDCTIVAIDSSPEMLEIFQNKIKKLSLVKEIVCDLSSAEKMSFARNRFDVIAATVALHHVKSKGPVIKKIFHCLKPGGRFALGEIDLDTSGRPDDPARLVRIMNYLKDEFRLVMKEGGVTAFSRMYDNGKKHILNNGEYCVGFGQWKNLCMRTGFRKVEISPVKEFDWFKVLVATK